MGILKNYSKGAQVIVIGHNMRQTIVWLLVIAGSLLTHWLFYDLLLDWISIIQCSNTLSVEPLGWPTVTIFIWVLAAIAFIRDKIK
jgi:hypothetical protein